MAETQMLAKYDPKSPVGSQSVLKGLLQTTSIKEAMRDLAPKHLKPEKLARMILAAASTNPRLLQCTQASILKSGIEATMLGLDCSGMLGQGYMVPYYNSKIDAYEAQFMAGYLGLCDLARRSGEIEDIYAVAVFDGDRFEYEEGLNRRLYHKPSDDWEQDRTKTGLRWVYAVGCFKSGYKTFRVMPVPEVESHRKRSKAKDSGPWVSDYVAMALKTVVRQLCKFLPLSVDLASQLDKEYSIDSQDDFGTQQIEAAELQPTGGKREKFGFTGADSASEQLQAGGSTEATDVGASTEGPPAGGTDAPSPPQEPSAFPTLPVEQEPPPPTAKPPKQLKGRGKPCGRCGKRVLQRRRFEGHLYCDNCIKELMAMKNAPPFEPEQPPETPEVTNEQRPDEPPEQEEKPEREGMYTCLGCRNTFDEYGPGGRCPVCTAQDKFIKATADIRENPNLLNF